MSSSNSALHKSALHFLTYLLACLRQSLLSQADIPQGSHQTDRRTSGQTCLTRVCTSPVFSGSTLPYQCWRLR